MGKLVAAPHDEAAKGIFGVQIALQGVLARLIEPNLKTLVNLLSLSLELGGFLVVGRSVDQLLDPLITTLIEGLKEVPV